jgi:hypothetical protein
MTSVGLPFSSTAWLRKGAEYRAGRGLYLVPESVPEHQTRALRQAKQSSVPKPVTARWGTDIEGRPQSDPDVTKAVLAAFERRVTVYHKDYDTAVNSSLAEEMLYKSFLDCGYNASWQRGNHATGEGDISTDTTLGRVEVKGNKLTLPKRRARIKTDVCIQFSGPRTTRYNDDMEGRIAALQHPSFETYCLIMRSEIEHKYFVWMIPAHLIHSQIPDLSAWTNRAKPGKKATWVATNGSFRFALQETMSWQLWVNIAQPIGSLGTPYVIDLPHVSW